MAVVEGSVRTEAESPVAAPVAPPEAPSHAPAPPPAAPRWSPARVVRWLGRAVRRLVWAVVRWVGTVGLAGAVIGAAVAVVARTAGHVLGEGGTATPTRPITFAPLAVRSVVYARDGSVLAELHAEEYRVPVPLERVPTHVVQAVLAAEDERFFDHGPLDVRSLVRAAVTNVEAGEVEEGGSTITQQLVKLELLTSKKDLERKVKEAVLAVQLEDQLTKSQILERYLNRVYFGNGAYGIQGAAKRYFGTDVDKLTAGQAALLAGVIRQPVATDPFLKPGPARERRDTVVDRMRHLGTITPEEAEKAKAEPLPTPSPPPGARPSDYFTERVKQELLAAEWLGATPEERYKAVFEGGLSIHTTLDPRAQQLAQGAVDSIVPDDPRGFTAAMVSVEPGTGAVRALVGGSDFESSKFNLVTDGEGRQVGSAFKVMTLVAAVESGMLPIDVISGSEPCPIENRGGAEDVWMPRNVEGGAAGTLNLAGATISSVNCAYARLVKLVGPEKVVDVAKRMGITKPLGAHLSLTLGSEPVTPLEMAVAYATLANDGVRNRPYFVEKVDNPDGSTRFAHTARPERVLSPETARIVNDVLVQTVSTGTGKAAAIPGWPVAGKTGSTDENADAWFVGYTPVLATAVWMGAPQGRVSMYGVGGLPRVYGGTFPAAMFGAYMRGALEGRPPVGLPGPPPPNRPPNNLPG